MISSISYLLAKNSRVTGFGGHRKRSTSFGRGYVLKVVGAVSRPALTYIANKIADVISGTGRKCRSVRKPRTVHSAGPWKPSGFGMRKKPRSTLTRKRRTTTVGTGHKTRKPRSPLRHIRRVAF